MSGLNPAVPPEPFRGTRYFLALAILYGILYGLTRAFLKVDVHAEWEFEYVRHALVLGILGWGALRWGRGWAWAGVVYLAGDLIHRIVVITAGTGVGIDPHIIFIKAFLLYMGYRSTRKISNPYE